MSTPTVRVWQLYASCHRVDQDHPDRFGGSTTTCGMLAPWQSTRIGLGSDVDCSRCLDIAHWRTEGENGRPS